MSDNSKVKQTLIDLGLVIVRKGVPVLDQADALREFRGACTPKTPQTMSVGARHDHIREQFKEYQAGREAQTLAELEECKALARDTRMPFKWNEDPDALGEADLLGAAINKLAEPYVQRIRELEQKCDAAMEKNYVLECQIKALHEERDHAAQRLKRMAVSADDAINMLKKGFQG